MTQNAASAGDGRPAGAARAARHRSPRRLRATSAATGRSSWSTSSSGSTPGRRALRDDLSATVHYGELAERLHAAIASIPST